MSVRTKVLNKIRETVRNLQKVMIPKLRTIKLPGSWLWITFRNLGTAKEPRPRTY